MFVLLSGGSARPSPREVEGETLTGENANEKPSEPEGAASESLAPAAEDKAGDAPGKPGDSLCRWLSWQWSCDNRIAGVRGPYTAAFFESHKSEP